MPSHPSSTRQPLAAAAAGSALLLAAVFGLVTAQQFEGMDIAPPLSLRGALCLGALAAALLLLACNRVRSAMWLALAAGFAGVLSLGSHLVLTAPGSTVGLIGQAPPATGFALALLGGATAALARHRHNSLAAHAAWACATTAVLVLGESWLRSLFGAGHVFFPTRRAESEGALFALLAASAAALALLARPGHPVTPQQQLDRYAVWCPILLAGLTLVAWSHLADREWRERTRETAQAANTIAQDIAARLQLRGTALQRLAERRAIYPEGDREAWERDAGSYLRDFPSMHAVNLVDPDLIVRWRVARPGAAPLVGRSVAAADGRLDVFRQAAATGQVRLTPATTLFSGAPGLVMVAPVRMDGRLAGYTSASLVAADLLEVTDRPMLRDFGVVLRQDAIRLAGDEGAPRGVAALFAQEAVLEALGQRWVVQAWPRPAYLARLRSQLPVTVFLLGLLAVGLATTAFLQARRSLASSSAAQSFAKRLTATLETISDAVFTLDSEWRVTYANREAERMLQRGRSALVGRVLWDEFPDALGTEFEHNYRRALQEQTAVVFEARYAPMDRSFVVRAYPAQGGLAVYTQDVTELVRSRAALRQGEQELLVLAESMPQMVWMATLDGKLSYLNQRWVEFTGMSLKDSLGDGWLRALHPEDRGKVEVAWQHVRAEGADNSLQARVRRADGEYRWMLIRAVPSSAPDGRIVRWMGTATDIDAIRRSVEAVRASEERFRLLARASNDAIWDCDLHTGAVWWSDNFERLFGHAPAAAATLQAWSTLFHPDDTEVVALSREAMAGGQEAWSADARLHRAGGGWARVHLRGSIIRDADGRPTRMVGAMSDVTTQHELEQQLRQAQRLESVGQLTGGVAHDFNNLLTVIVGNAEALTEELAGKPALQQLAAMVLTAAERGAELTQRLLAFARKQALAPVAVDIRRQLADLEPLLLRTLGEHVQVRLQLAEDLWPALVDPAQLDNALLNLCLNARDAMPGGGTLTLAASNARLEADDPQRQQDVAAGDYLRLSVTDTGVGIAAADAQRVFEPFFTTKTVGKGTGLGLAMVYGFVRQSGGQVGVASQPGQGSTFTLYLPRARAEAGGADAPAPAPAAGPGAGSVLLVEDDPLVRSYVRGQLSGLGYQVTAAANGEEALALLQQGLAVDLLFTDLVMPGMSGPELARRAQEAVPGLRVLFTSGYAEDAMLRQSRVAPGSDLLPKPYAREELARRVRAALQAGR